MAAAEGETRSTGGTAPWLITAWFIWTVLFVSTVIGAVVVFRIDHGSWEGTDRAVLRVGIVGIIASVLAWMSYEAPAFFRRRTRGLIKSPNARYLVNFLLSLLLSRSQFGRDGGVCLDERHGGRRAASVLLCDEGTLVGASRGERGMCVSDRHHRVFSLGPTHEARNVGLGRCEYRHACFHPVLRDSGWHGRALGYGRAAAS